MLDGTGSLSGVRVRIKYVTRIKGQSGSRLKGQGYE